MALVVANDGCRMSSEGLNVHPFFKPASQKAAGSALPATPAPSGTATREWSDPQCTTARADNEEVVDGYGTLPAAQIPHSAVNRKPITTAVSNGQSADVPAGTSNEDAREPHSKRRKVTPQAYFGQKEEVDLVNGQQLIAVGLDQGKSGLGKIEQVHVPAQTIDLTEPTKPKVPALPERPNAPPTKIMKLRTDGKLFSPPKKDRSQESIKRGRKSGTTKKQAIVVLKYGVDEASRREVGDKIEKILKGELRVRPQPSLSEEKPLPSVKVSSATPTKKSTHPFFLGQRKPDASELRSSSPPRSTGNTSRSTSPHKPFNPASKPSISPLFGLSATKFAIPPHAEEPLWPPEGMVHVRDIEYRPQCTNLTSQQVAGKYRKSKESQVRMKPEEKILSRLENLVSDQELREIVSKEDTNYPQVLRLIAERTYLPTLVEKQLTQRVSDHCQQHVSVSSDLYTSHQITSVAAERLFDSLPNAKSAFDEFKCDSQEWVVKYRPRSSEEVLQSSNCMELLKNWLTVSAVHSTTNINALPAKKNRKSMKRRKQASELDDFIVGSDEEDIVDESDMHQYYKPDMSSFRFEKTAIRPNLESRIRRLTTQNISQTKGVILCGPRGCGKTAGVQAVAQELGFEIFEINAGSRRSGRDVLEKVGDMTKNHLVNQGTNRPEDDEVQVQVQDAAEIGEEIASGKQSTMQSFFKSKPTTNTSKQKVLKSVKPSQTSSQSKQDPKRIIKAQKQSLILLEEVDVLFEEDKLFWTTVIALLGTSKRPIIMTCNDESLLSKEGLEDCSLLRLTAPPENAAIDYLLLMAAHEGHLLERDAVASLYTQNQSDLRASIMQMNFWCQMAINDPTGGLNWMLFPQDYKGTDVQIADQRVMSKGTLHAHIGMMGSYEPATATKDEHDLQRLLDVVYEWELGIEDLLLNHTDKGTRSAASSRTLLDELSLYDAALDALSVSDVQESVCRRSQISSHLYISDMQDRQLGNSFTSNLPVLQLSSGLSSLGSEPAVSISLAFQALSQLALLGTQSSNQFGRNKLCNGLLKRKASLPDHQRLVKTTEAVALAPIVELLERNTKSVSTDLNSYIRGIIAYDFRLEQERTRLSGLLSDGSRQGKRQRTTRASRAALEGGHKSSTRREQWFEADVDTALILETGGSGWSDIVANQYEKALRRSRWVQQAENTESDDELAR